MYAMKLYTECYAKNKSPKTINVPTCCEDSVRILCKLKKKFYLLFEEVMVALGVDPIRGVSDEEFAPVLFTHSQIKNEINRLYRAGMIDDKAAFEATPKWSIIYEYKSEEG
jgi:hypothetical protein